MSVQRVYAVVEGQTEETVFNELLRPEFGARGLLLVVEVVQKPGHEGGNKWVYLERHLRNLMKQHKGRDVRFTTFFDLYALDKSFPQFDAHAKDPDGARRATALETAISAHFDDDRLMPYLQCHEFETLLFADLEKFDALLDQPKDKTLLQDLIQDTAAYHQLPRTVEDINDRPETHPSMRLERCMPSPGQRKTRYKKRAMGAQVAKAIGLPKIRSKCPRFNDWIAGLEAFAPLQSPPQGDFTGGPRG